MPILNPSEPCDRQTYQCDGGGCGFTGPAFTMIPITSGEWAGKSSGTGNYGVPADSVGPAHATICPACCAKRDAEDMAKRHAAGQHFQTYLSCDGKTVGTWHGNPLGKVISSQPCALTRPSNFHDRKSYRSIRVLDLAGREWHGRGSAGICITLRPCKGKR